MNRKIWQREVCKDYVEPMEYPVRRTLSYLHHTLVVMKNDRDPNIRKLMSDRIPATVYIINRLMQDFNDEHIFPTDKLVKELMRFKTMMENEGYEVDYPMGKLQEKDCFAYNYKLSIYNNIIRLKLV